MTTFSAQFLGCKVSRTDLEALREGLAAEGYEEVPTGGALHVVNGCCVTAEAVVKTRQAVRRALAEGAANVVVTGCAARLPALDRAGLDPRVHVVARPAEETPAAVVGLARSLGCQGGAPADPFARRVRAFVKVQDGCSFSCSFCIIPLVRGGTRSRPLVDLAAEAARRVRQGRPEVVITGVNVGLYRDGRQRLPDVIRAVGAVPGVRRLRLSSVEVDHLDPALVSALAETRAVLPHLHVPMQSGDDGVLAAMRRRASAGRYAERIAAARAALPGLNVTADVIVGFPTEDEAAFERTLDLVRETGLSRVHAFPYSPRPGTRTAGDDPVPPASKRDRSRRVRALAALQGHTRLAARIGEVDEVLVERIGSDGRATGYARDYTSWSVTAPGARPGDVIAARAVAADDDTILAGSIA